MPKIADKYYITDPWKVIERGYNPAYSRVSESVFSLANESTGTRGFFDEAYSGDSLRGLYVNGVYELEELPKSYRGIIDKAHYMVPAADWLLTDIEIDGEVLDLSKADFSDFIRELDMRSGLLKRQFTWHTKSGKNIRLTFYRFLDMINSERAYQRIEFEALNFSGRVNFTSAIGFNTLHEGRKQCCWDNIYIKTPSIPNSLAIRARTRSSMLEVFAGAIVSAMSAGSDINLDASIIEGEKYVSLNTQLNLIQTETLTIDKKVIILYDGTDGDTLQKSGLAHIKDSAEISFDTAFDNQRNYWKKHWETADVIIEPQNNEDTETALGEQQGIRYCSFQMTQTYTGNSIRHNIGAKGLTGEAYNGHAFWDTEACCLPFYLFTNPAAAKSLLIFRYNTLPQALERAKMLDCTGACYPIATLNGDEACNLWQHASLQFQPSTAVAYGIWHYIRITDDEGFLWDYGAEMLLQISRFLVSRSGQNPHTGQYGYYGVMGPDEFQMMVNNNAYTNYMAKRTLEYARETLIKMKTETAGQYKALADKTGFKEAELDIWLNIASNMAINITDEGIIEQHDGYFNLPHIDIHSIPISEFPLYAHWSYDRIYRNDMIKQPDVLMFLYLYNSSFSQEMKKANFDFYEPRTIHESSLSPAVHSILAAELGYMDAATEFFGFATRLDLDNYNRNTHEGLHTTSIAMAWINIVYGFAGLRSDGELLRFSPRLPERWSRLCFTITYKERVITVDMRKDATVFKLRKGTPVEFLIFDNQYTLGQKEILI